MITYYRLFDQLKRRNIKKNDLLQVISPSTLLKLEKGKNVRTDTIEKICSFLDCQPGDIMEIVCIEKDDATGKEQLIKRCITGIEYDYDGDFTLISQYPTLDLPDEFSDRSYLWNDEIRDFVHNRISG